MSGSTTRQKRFRQVLSHFPTGVVIVTGITPSGPAGVAVGSFASVSLEPPLVGFFVGRDSTSWPPIRSAGRFCVNVLASDQAELCRRFSQSGTDKFAGVSWRPAPSGAPLLDGVLAWIDCDLQREVETGDHSLVLGAVTELAVAREGQPLLFHRGGFPYLELS